MATNHPKAWMLTRDPEEGPLGVELRALGQEAADLGLRLAAAAARVLDASRRDARELAKASIERDEAQQDLRAETVRSGALAQRVDALEAGNVKLLRMVDDANARAESLAEHADRVVTGAGEDEECLRNLYEAKCEEADSLSAQLGGGCGVDAEIDRLQKMVAEAESAMDRAVANERSALTDLAKLRSCFEAQRKALCDRLGLDATASWSDITQRVR